MSSTTVCIVLLPVVILWLVFFFLFLSPFLSSLIAAGPCHFLFGCSVFLLLIFLSFFVLLLC
jgi:hypothetical protein